MGVCIDCGADTWNCSCGPTPRSVETKPESVIGKCIDKPIKDEALTAEDRDAERLAINALEND